MYKRQPQQSAPHSDHLAVASQIRKFFAQARHLSLIHIYDACLLIYNAMQCPAVVNEKATGMMRYALDDLSLIHI